MDTNVLSKDDILDADKYAEHKARVFKKKMKALRENIQNGTVVVKENGGWSFTGGTSNHGTPKI